MMHRCLLLAVTLSLLAFHFATAQPIVFGVNWSPYDSDTSHAGKLARDLHFNAFHFGATDSSSRAQAKAWKQNTQGTNLFVTPLLLG
jgi:hypothetical protein